MTLWLALVLLTLATLGGLLWPLLRRRTKTPARIDFDIAVYRDQLAGIETDAAQGLIGTHEAAAMRTEIERRMLAAGAIDAPGGDIRARTMRRPLIAILAVVVLLPGGAFYLYRELGVPGLPGAPYAERAKNDPDFALSLAADNAMIKLRDHPGAEGYKRVGAVFTALRRFGRAAEAYGDAVRLDPKDSETWSLLGESIALSNGDTVTPNAEDAFLRAFRRDRADARAEYYLGLAKAQAGDPRAAIAIWRDLERNSDPDAPWSMLIAQRIKTLADKSKLDPERINPGAPVDKFGNNSGQNKESSK